MLETLINRLDSLRRQFTDVNALKQFREDHDPARQGFLMILRARIDELTNAIKTIKPC